MSNENSWCSRKALLLLGLLTGLACAVFLSSVRFGRSAVQDHAIDMFGAQLAAPSRIAMRGSSAMTCPRPHLAMSVNAMQNVLRKHGIPTSPLERFALTQYAATRDVSMAAQAKEEFSMLDPVTQDKLKKLSRDVVVRASSLKPEEMAGVTAPLGFFDPLGFSKGDNLAVYRVAELKHGRICMLATLGMIVGENFHPFFDAWGDGKFASAAASHFSPTAMNNFWPAFWVLTGVIEWPSLFNTDSLTLESAGDLGFDPLGAKPTDPQELKALQTKELNNGRLAMLAAAGVMAQELVTGQSIFKF